MTPDFLKKLLGRPSSAEERTRDEAPPRHVPDASSADPPALYVFDHIPKTAGTTFRRSYLRAAFPRDERWILSGGDKNAEDRERFLQLPAQARRRIRIVAGHYVDSLRAHVPDARFLTVVRDPVDRLVSSYRHALFHPGGETLWPDVREKQMGLREFVLKYERPNAQSIQLVGEGDFDEHALAQRLGTRYALIGYTEAFDEFVFLLHALEGFPLCLYNNRLVGEERSGHAPSGADLTFVREMNARDLLLHRVVKARFQQQVQALPPVTRATMARYVEALGQFRAATAGDPTQSLRLDDSVRDERAVQMFAFVFGRPPLGADAAQPTRTGPPDR